MFLNTTNLFKTTFDNKNKNSNINIINHPFRLCFVSSPGAGKQFVAEPSTCPRTTFNKVSNFSII